MDCCGADKQISTPELMTMSVWNAVNLYSQEKHLWDFQKLAEVTYAIAMGLAWSAKGMSKGFKDAAHVQLEKAKSFAQICSEAFNTLPSKDTQADCAPIHTVIAGVVIPDLFYKEYAELRFRQLGLLD